MQTDRQKHSGDRVEKHGRMDVASDRGVAMDTRHTDIHTQTE